MAAFGKLSHSADMEDFGKRLARRHAQLGLNGRHTAERLGLHYQTFQKLLSGRVKGLPHPDLLLRLADALALTPRQLLGLVPVPGLDDDTTVPDRELLAARIRAALLTFGEADFTAARTLLENLLQDWPQDQPAGAGTAQPEA